MSKKFNVCLERTSPVSQLLKSAIGKFLLAVKGSNALHYTRTFWGQLIEGPYFRMPYRLSYSGCAMLKVVKSPTYLLAFSTLNFFRDWLHVDPNALS